MLPDLKRYICDALTEHGDIGQRALNDQWKYLIFQPLKSLLPCLTLILVIDALDECEDDRNLRKILQLLAQVKDLKTVQLRVFLTSRPETPIRLGFREMPGIIYHDEVLHNTPRSVIEHDISIFLRHEMDRIRKERALERDWPGEDNIKILAGKANPLFIYAAAACRFIAESRYPEQRLSQMLQVNSASQSSTKKLDEMYTLVLEHSVIGDADEDEKDLRTRLFKQVVGSIVILFNSLSARALTELLAVSAGEMNGTLEPMHSVLDISDDLDSPIRLFHVSFSDFLLDNKRCFDNQFWVNERKAHSDLVENCLRVMSSALKRDICNLQKPGRLASEIDRNSVDECLPVYIQYACRYWVDHFMRSDIELCDNGPVHKFVQKHFLHWLEALSLMGKMSEGVLMITALQSKLVVSDFMPLCHDLCHDLNR